MTNIRLSSQQTNSTHKACVSYWAPPESPLGAADTLRGSEPSFLSESPQEVRCVSQGSLTQFLVKPAVSCVEERALCTVFQTSAATVLPPGVHHFPQSK